MSGFWLFLTVVFIVSVLSRRSCYSRRRYAGFPEGRGPDPRDAEIDRLTERVRTLEKIITDSDWRLRRDFDNL